MAEDAKLIKRGFEQKMLDLTPGETVISASPSTQPRTEQTEVASAITIESVKAVRSESARADDPDVATTAQ